MTQTELSPKLYQHFLEGGRFGPFSYAIGLDTSVQEYCDAAKSYPIAEPISDETFTDFLRSLTFFHEGTHLCQYISSAFGLRCIRYTIILLNRLRGRPNWALPIIGDLHNRLDELSPPEMAAYKGCLVFTDAMNQLRLDHDIRPAEHHEVDNKVQIEFRPWSPHFQFRGLDTNAERRETYAVQLREIGVNVRRLPILTFTGPKGAHRIVLNAAALMEGYAVICELNHIHNALNLSWLEALSLVPQGNEYHALLAYLVQEGLCPPQYLLATLAVCIDAALMYDPFILYNVPWEVADAFGRRDVYPGETFLRLCDALRKTGPLKESTVDQTDKFYRALCVEAGLPDPGWMATRTYEIARDVLSTASENAILRKPLKAHCDALKYRCDHNPTYFPVALMTSDTLMDLMELAIPITSFYNLRTQKPDRFDPSKVDGLSIHSILLQAISEKRIECPLKMGSPFYCENAVSPSNVLCVWRSEGMQHECYVDVVERLFGLSAHLGAPRQKL